MVDIFPPSNLPMLIVTFIKKNVHFVLVALFF